MRITRDLVGTIGRGLRARALLSLGSLLLTSLAVASAVLGPLFQIAATNSYVVARLSEEPNLLTGLTWTFRPGSGLAGDPAAAAAQAAAVVAPRTSPVFSDPMTSLVTPRVWALGGQAMLLARPDACAHLVVEGRCPTAPGEALMQSVDLEQAELALGERIPLVRPGWPALTVVGVYSAPEEERDFWFDLSRLASVPESASGIGPGRPYQPAPLITDASTFDQLPPGSWRVLVDNRLDPEPGLTPADLDAAVASAEAMRERSVPVDGGRLRGELGNELGPIADEVRGQQETARLTIAPAVISLVLVALALLLRLLMAAAELRRPELALASLRGLSSRRMWALGLAEPVAILVVATPLGIALGVGTTWVLARQWLVPGLPLTFTPWSVVAAGLVVLAAAAIAVVAVGQVLREELSTQLAGVRRPSVAGPARVVAELLVVAATLAVLAGELVGEDRGRPDATDLVLPILLAVTAGLLATRVTAGLAGWWTRRRRAGRSLPGFVAARAISRRQEGTLVILPLTAAIAVGVFAGGVYESAADWRASAAATAAPAAVVWSSTMPMDQTVALTHRIDPDGEWVMAASTLLDQQANLALLDTPRLSRIAMWSDQWTPGMSAADIQDLVAPAGTPPELAGRRIGLTGSADVDAADDVFLQLRLASTDGETHTAFVGPLGPDPTAVSDDAPYCGEGCRLTGITVAGPAGQPMRMRGEVTVTGLTADGAEVTGFGTAGWLDESEPGEPSALAGLSAGEDVLVVEVDSGADSGSARLGAGDVPVFRPVVVGLQAGGSIEPTEGGEEIGLDSAGSVSVNPVADAESVPFLGPGGILLDYTMFVRHQQLNDTLSRVYVLGRSDTPDDVVQALTRSGMVVTATFDDVRATLDQDAYALALSLYAVVAVLVLAMAFAGLAVSTAVQLPARRRDAASLRVVGVRRRAIMSSVVWEYLVVLGGATAAGIAAGTLAQYVVMRTVTLGFADDATTPQVVAELDWQRLSLLAVIAAIALGVAAVASAALTVRGARGATLRENAR